MKKYSHSAALVGMCTSAFCLTSAHGQTGQVVAPPSAPGAPVYYYSSPMSRFYVGADAGGVVTLDTKVKEFFGPVPSNTGVHLDPGVRFGFVGGYHLTEWLSLEGETGVMANNINSIDGATIFGNATLLNVPFLANVRLQLPVRRCPLTPYIGGGGGGSFSILDFSDEIDLNGVALTGSDSAPVFAYQAFAGLRWAINDRMGIGVEYHYFATTGPTWSADTFGTTSDHMKFAGVQSHAASIAFDYHF
jgi:opacity protein-like surface antigen